MRKTELIIMHARRGKLEDWYQFPATSKTHTEWQVLEKDSIPSDVFEKLVVRITKGSTQEVVRTMHIAPITRDSLLRLAVATVAPIAPLALTMMPFEELVGKLLGILFSTNLELWMVELYQLNLGTMESRTVRLL